MCGSDGTTQKDLAEAREVDRFAEDTHSFLRCVIAHRVFSLDEVELELCAALEVA
jgi:hypothetical protein